MGYQESEYQFRAEFKIGDSWGPFNEHAMFHSLEEAELHREAQLSRYLPEKAPKSRIVQRAVEPWRPTWDASHDQDVKCRKCGHAYERHWDSWETPPLPVGCKYCGCSEFEEGRWVGDDHLIVDYRGGPEGEAPVTAVCKCGETGLGGSVDEANSVLARHVDWPEVT